MENIQFTLYDIYVLRTAGILLPYSQDGLLELNPLVLAEDFLPTLPMPALGGIFTIPTLIPKVILPVNSSSPSTSDNDNEDANLNTGSSSNSTLTSSPSFGSNAPSPTPLPESLYSQTTLQYLGFTYSTALVIYTKYLLGNLSGQNSASIFTAVYTAELYKSFLTATSSGSHMGSKDVLAAMGITEELQDVMMRSELTLGERADERVVKAMEMRWKTLLELFAWLKVVATELDLVLEEDLQDDLEMETEDGMQFVIFDWEDAGLEKEMDTVIEIELEDDDESEIIIDI